MNASQRPKRSVTCPLSLAAAIFSFYYLYQWFAHRLTRTGHIFCISAHQRRADRSASFCRSASHFSGAPNAARMASHFVYQHTLSGLLTAQQIGFRFVPRFVPSATCRSLFGWLFILQICSPSGWSDLLKENGHGFLKDSSLLFPTTLDVDDRLSVVNRSHSGGINGMRP